MRRAQLRNTARLKQLDKDYVWHPFTQMKTWGEDGPLIIDRAKGVYLYDTDGNKYIDGISSLWVNVHGHGHKVIDAALKKQIDKLSHSTLLGLGNTPSIELAARLIDIAPKGLAKVFYSDNGSTAVEIALKMAYQYWQNIARIDSNGVIAGTGTIVHTAAGDTVAAKGRFPRRSSLARKRILVHLNNSYHGDTLGSVSVGGIDLFHKVYRGLIFKTHGLKTNGTAAVEEFEQLLKVKSEQIAALIVEPLVQGAAGMIVWPQGTLSAFRRLCTRYNVLLIVDEVATGFGRTGTMFACEQEKVSPDLLCIAKGLTGGYLPLAATLTTQKIYDGFVFDHQDLKTFFHGHTYTGNPLTCAAALASLDTFSRERTLARLAPKIKFLAKQLKMFYNLRSVTDVRQCGFMAAIELKGRLEDRVGAKICQIARRHGVILRPLGNVIVIMPPLSITTVELKALLAATYTSMHAFECA